MLTAQSEVRTCIWTAATLRVTVQFCKDMILRPAQRAFAIQLTCGQCVQIGFNCAFCCAPISTRSFSNGKENIIHK